MTTIELTSEYNTLSTFLELNDPRVEESKMNIVADEDGDLTLLTNDIGKDGQRFVEEVFLYGDRIETHPLVANKIRAGASAGTAVNGVRSPSSSATMFPLLHVPTNTSIKYYICKIVRKIANASNTRNTTFCVIIVQYLFMYVFF